MVMAESIMRAFHDGIQEASKMTNNSTNVIGVASGEITIKNVDYQIAVVLIPKDYHIGLDNDAMVRIAEADNYFNDTVKDKMRGEGIKPVSSC